MSAARSAQPTIRFVDEYCQSASRREKGKGKRGKGGKRELLDLGERKVAEGESAVKFLDFKAEIWFLAPQEPQELSQLQELSS